MNETSKFVKEERERRDKIQREKEEEIERKRAMR